MASTPPKAPADAGKLARLLAESGDLTTAVSLVRNNISSGVSGNAGDYADQIAVLNQAGLTGEAQNLISNPQLQASSTPTQLASIRNGYVINEADRLREQGNYAAAYDKLIRAMQSDPQNTDLMFAMARLYQSGKMNKEAGVVYDYLMTRDTPNQMRAPGPSTWRCRRGTTIALNSWPAVCAGITPRIAYCCWREWRRPGTSSAGDDLSAQRPRQTAGHAKHQQ